MEINNLRSNGVNKILSVREDGYGGTGAQLLKCRVVFRNSKDVDDHYRPTQSVQISSGVVAVELKESDVA